jgi:hypothetical protein
VTRATVLLLLLGGIESARVSFMTSSNCCYSSLDFFFHSELSSHRDWIEIFIQILNLFLFFLIDSSLPNSLSCCDFFNQRKLLIWLK